MLVGTRADSAGEYPLREGLDGETERGGGWWGIEGKGVSAKCADLAGLADGALPPPGVNDELDARAYGLAPLAIRAAAPADEATRFA